MRDIARETSGDNSDGSGDGDDAELLNHNMNLDKFSSVHKLDEMFDEVSAVVMLLNISGG
jgi:hypothetical protein